MPAKAGIHAYRDAVRRSWTPAFAGVTELLELSSENSLRHAPTAAAAW